MNGRVFSLELLTNARVRYKVANGNIVKILLIKMLIVTFVVEKLRVNKITNSLGYVELRVGYLW